MGTYDGGINNLKSSVDYEVCKLAWEDKLDAENKEKIV